MTIQFNAGLVLLFVFQFGLHKHVVSQNFEWTKAAGIFGGNVEAISFASECEIYAGTLDAGLHFTSDCGESWQDLGFNFVGPNLAHINGLMVDNEGVIFMAINSRGVYRREPGVTEWTQWNLGLPLDQYDCLDKGIEGRPTICTRGFGLFQLMNGTTWEQLPDPALSGADVRGFAINDTVLVIGTKGGDGVYFYNLEEERSRTIGSIDSNIIRDIHLDGQYLFAPTISNGIRMLNLQDTTWQTITEDIPTGQFQSVTTANDRVYAGSFGLGVYSRSIDMSDEWVRELDIDVTSNVLTSFGETIYAGTNNGIYRNDGVDRFEPIGPETGLIRSFGEHNGELFAGTFDNGIWTSFDGGLSWQQDFPTSFSFFSIYPSPSKNLVLAGTFDREVFTRPLEAGEEWSSAGLSFRQINDFEVLSNGDIVAATNTGISRLQNDSTKWISLELTNKRVRDLHETRGQLVATTSEGVYINKIPSEGNWQQVSEISLRASAWSANGFGDLLVVNSPPNGIHTFNFSSMEGEQLLLPTPDIVDFVVVSNELWLAADYNGYVYLTEDAGQSWESLPDSPEESRLRKIWVTSDGSILLGTESNGIYKSSPVIPVSTEYSLPFSSSSSTFYPNPAKSVATFELEAKIAQYMTWTIYDNLGRPVLESDNFVSAGRNALRIELKDLAPGLYIFGFSLHGQNIRGSKSFVVQ